MGGGGSLFSSFGVLGGLRGLCFQDTPNHLAEDDDNQKDDDVIVSLGEEETTTTLLFGHEARDQRY